MNSPRSPGSVWAQGRLGKADGEPEIIFAQVREDASVELEVLRSRPAEETAFCIASGGCTAFALLLAGTAQLQIVDINPAQIYLVELKKAALQRLAYHDAMHCLLGDARPYRAELFPHVSQSAQEFWQDHERLLAQGLNNCGLIEQRLRQVMKLLPLAQNRRNIRRLFGAKTLLKQKTVYELHWNHWRWKLAFELVLSKPVLRLAYGDAFVSAVPRHFARLVRQRVEDAFLRFPIRENGYLWQTFRGTYSRHEASLPMYLQRENRDTVLANLPNAILACADAAEWLENQPPASIGFFALSNILEVTTPAYRQRLLRAVARAAKPDAKVCLRSIFPADVALIDGMAEFGQMPADELEQRDRSFFCKNLRLLNVHGSDEKRCEMEGKPIETINVPTF